MSNSKKKSCSCLCFPSKKSRNKHSKNTAIENTTGQGPFNSPSSNYSTQKNNSIGSVITFQPKIPKNSRKKSLDFNFPTIFKPSSIRSPGISPKEKLDNENIKNLSMLRAFSLPKMPHNSQSPINNRYSEYEEPIHNKFQFSKTQEKNLSLNKKIDKFKENSLEIPSQKVKNIEMPIEKNRNDEDLRKNILNDNEKKDYVEKNQRSSEKIGNLQEMFITSPNYTQISQENISPKGFMLNIPSETIENLFEGSSDVEKYLNLSLIDEDYMKNYPDEKREGGDEFFGGKQNVEDFGEQYNIADNKGFIIVNKNLKLPPLKPITPHYFNRRKRMQSNEIPDLFTYA
ncbi:hypothetical protein SteCoe_26866 [Stentor coeruleus]|uniref:Uncharacterized protein n=1 Tax=Stentor coeruleus TaxID=5963 RepID=A0A1R2BC78_9CILI|nr:hypothetical protein SteCoe_26866 [Stentor coeruleus]